MKKTVLILCTGNSCRSQMAEALLRECAGDLLDVASAGCDPAGYIHPLAIEVMAEIGIDIAGWDSKSHQEYLNQSVQTVVTVCGNANDCCPVFPGQLNRYHWSFDDPAKFEGEDEIVKSGFRRVRDEIKLVMTAYVAGLVERDAEKVPA
ncbi:arsenate reductase ArsC [Verrucomicrobiaceae bacterium 227]